MISATTIGRVLERAGFHCCVRVGDRPVDHAMRVVAVCQVSGGLESTAETWHRAPSPQTVTVKERYRGSVVESATLIMGLPRNAPATPRPRIAPALVTKVPQERARVGTGPGGSVTQ